MWFLLVVEVPCELLTYSVIVLVIRVAWVKVLMDGKLSAEGCLVTVVPAWGRCLLLLLLWICTFLWPVCVHYCTQMNVLLSLRCKWTDPKSQSTYRGFYTFLYWKTMAIQIAEESIYSDVKSSVRNGWSWWWKNLRKIHLFYYKHSIM